MQNIIPIFYMKIDIQEYININKTERCSKEDIALSLLIMISFIIKKFGIQVKMLSYQCISLK